MAVTRAPTASAAVVERSVGCIGVPSEAGGNESALAGPYPEQTHAERTEYGAPDAAVDP